MADIAFDIESKPRLDGHKEEVLAKIRQEFDPKTNEADRYILYLVSGF